ncbi:HFR056Wp [Eremothecium sinecaudum]|uniref:Protein DOM34 homolog n=1 Tax=Eremothecium sinecaudum TaxID=45286 RepID=A0A0X8HU76_9SACH|nr:HFR056Wp [Eremothecium sinecaudum]AMD21911.1 HFR056Wp [Eremothecium sinecaudum]
MKLISQKNGSANTSEAIITLLPQEKEDLFTLYNIINKDDEIIYKKKLSLKADENSKKKTTELVKLRIKIVSSEFEPKHEYLKYKGVTTEDDFSNANVDVPVGKFYSMVVNYQYPFTIIKHDFNSYCQKLLKESCNVEGRSDIAAVVLQEGIAHICMLSPSSTILKHKVEYSFPKKKRETDIMKFNEKLEKFYKATYTSMLRHFDFDKVKVILLCSPAFYAKILHEKILQYAQEDQNKTVLDNKSKFLVAHCSTGYLQGLTEVMRDPSYSSMLKNARNSQETRILDEFLSHLNSDDYKAWYGRQEVEKAADLGAIDLLLLTDTWMRSDDVVIRKKSLDLVNNVEKMGGKAIIFSSMHASGEQLDQLTGLACILKYPIADLDEDLEDEDEEA